MQTSDRLLEAIYNLADRQRSERARSEVARAALLAAQHRANALEKPQPKERKEQSQ